MKRWVTKVKKFKDREDGSATIEFLGMVPIVLLLLVVLWQFLVGINAVLVTQSAVNEYATVYSITKEKLEAQAASEKIINATGDYLTFNSYVNEPEEHDKEFTTELAVNIHLVFLPKKLFGGTTPSITYNATAHGRVIE